MSNLSEAAYVKAPIAGNIIELTISTTTQAFLIPVAFQGKYCRFKVFAASGSISAYIAFGLSTVNVTAATLSGISAGVITPVADSGERVESGTTENWVMPMIDDVTTHFSIDASGTGRLQIIKAG